MGQASRNLNAVIRAGENASETALGVVGAMITNQVKILVTGPPYSRPGFPPGLRTGGLRLSYRWEVNRGRGKRGAYVTVASDQRTHQPVPPGKAVVYAPYLEFGTSRMAARPHLRPAVEMIRPLIPGIVGAAWSGGVRRRNGGNRGR
jgi:hypothetical protein